MKTSLSSTS